MKNQITTFNDLPQRMDQVLEEIRELKRLYVEKIAKAEEIPKFLNIDEALKYLHSHGIKISKSKIYKMSAKGELDNCKIEGRLYFTKVQLNNFFNNGT